MYRFIKKVLFLFHPDLVHAWIVELGSVLPRIPGMTALLDKLYVYEHPALERTVLGIKFKNPIGLAGGFDKNCELIETIPHIGFGFMEVGSITRFPYGGNQRPWSARLKDDGSLVVNYGLKNEGVEVLVRRIAQAKRSIPLIINIAKTNDPTIKGEGTIEDYIYSYQKLEPLADIVNINISCPNTGDGVLLCEDMGLLERLLDALQKAYEASEHKKPIVLKLKPDISDTILAQIVALVKRHTCVKGFVVSNLSKNRDLLSPAMQRRGEKFVGGISGKPIAEISTQMIKRLRVLAGKEYAIIGLGGVFSAEDAQEKLDAGADLVELVTGMIYEGPGVVKKIAIGLMEKN